MKRLIILSLLLTLVGCQKTVDEKLLELGYQLDDVNIIMTYPEDVQEIFLEGLNEVYISLMHLKGFKIENLDEYMKYRDIIDNTKMVEFVNNGFINDENKYRLKQLYENEFYVARLEDLYLKYLQDYDSVRDVIEIVNTKRYLQDYTNTKQTDISKNYLMLINKYNYLPEDYEPADLVDVEPGYGRGRTRQEVYAAFKQMRDDAVKEGYSFRITSAYRSYAIQKGLYLNYQYTDPENVDTYSARPGHSEHQSGLCLDLAATGYGMDNFGLSPASTWVNEHCSDYGFIIRYTEEKVGITGYQAEPWQVRYVGSVEIAKFIEEKGITFDEYYTCYVE